MNYYIEKLKNAVNGRTVVFIDAANLEKSVQDLKVKAGDRLVLPADVDLYCWRTDYKKIKIFLRKICLLTEVRFYSARFNSYSHNQFLTFLKKELGFKLNTKEVKEYRDHRPEAPHRKANFDVEIAVDAILSLKNYDTFILFSGDCDFAYLLSILKGRGKTTIVFSRAGHVAKELIIASVYYFDIAKFRGQILKIQKRK